MSKIFQIVLMAAALLIVSTNTVFAQFPGGLNYASVSGELTPMAVAPGGTSTVVVKVVVNHDFHINSNHPNDPDLIPTMISANGPSGVVFGTPIYPRAKTIAAPSAGQLPLSVYIGMVTVALPVTVKREAKSGGYPLAISLQYQGCNASACFPPKVSVLHLSLFVK